MKMTNTMPRSLRSIYARLKSLGWTQQRIAKAKNVTKGTVSKRITFNSVSDKIKVFVSQGLLSEFHLEETCSCFVAKHLSPWLTTSQVWEELAEKAVDGRAKKAARAVQQKVVPEKPYVSRREGRNLMFTYL